MALVAAGKARLLHDWAGKTCQKTKLTSRVKVALQGGQIHTSVPNRTRVGLWFELQTTEIEVAWPW